MVFLLFSLSAFDLHHNSGEEHAIQLKAEISEK